MTANNMIRWGAPLTILGGLLLMVFAIAVDFIGESHWGFHALNAPPNALLALGIVGIYLYLRRQGTSASWAGSASTSASSCSPSRP